MSDYSLPQFGIPNQSPFDILKRPRSQAIAPAKQPIRRGAKGKLILSALSTPSGNFGVQIASRASSDRTNSIRGRSL